MNLKKYFWIKITNFIIRFNKGAELQVRTAVESVSATRRKKSQTIADLFSFVGGLLGLFAGFSFLAGAELLFYFIISPLKLIRSYNDSRVYPLTRTRKNLIESLAESRVVNFVKEMLQESSIHSINHIAVDGMCLFERYVRKFGVIQSYLSQ